MLTYTIPTLQQCEEVCNKNKKFVKSVIQLNDKHIINFSSTNTAFDVDFELPYKKCKHDIFEFEGLCFIDDKPNLMIRHPMLYNRMTDTWLNKFNSLDIKYIQSISGNPLIRFIKIGNTVYAKDIKGFNSVLTDYANKVYASEPNFKCFVDWSLENDKVALFEINNGLFLTGMRDNITGVYEPFALWNDCEYWDVKKIKQYRHFLLEDLFLPEKMALNWLVYFDNNDLIFVT